MATLTLRQTSPASGTNKGAPLTNAEVDANFNSLDTSKVEKSGDTLTGTLIFKAGTTTVAPFKMQTGTNLTSPAAGAVEFDGTFLYFTPSGTRNKIAMNTSGNFIRTITGTSNQVLVSGSGSADAAVTLTTPQDIATTSNVTFGSMLVGSATFPSGTVAGQIRASHDVVAYSTSDERLKTNVEVISNAIEKVAQLRGVTFTWDANSADVHGHEGQDTGVLAQEVQAVLPEVVTIRDNGFMAVKYEKMIGLLIEAIKELDAKLCKCSCNK